MSEQPDEQDGTAEEVTEAAAEQPLAAWSEPADGPAWSNIEDEAGSSAPGPAGPGASPEAPEEAPTQVQPATEAGRSRRPTSLRDQYIKSDEDIPWRKLDPPAFPSAPSFPGSPIAPVSEGQESGKTSGQVSDFESTPNPEPTATPTDDPTPGPSLKQRLDKLPLDKLSLSSLPLDKLPTGKLPTDKLPTDKLPVDKLRTLAKQRPEVGLAAAFAGGLLIATILKRLGRR